MKEFNDKEIEKPVVICQEDASFLESANKTCSVEKEKIIEKSLQLKNDEKKENLFENSINPKPEELITAKNINNLELQIFENASKSSANNNVDFESLENDENLSKANLTLQPKKTDTNQNIDDDCIFETLKVTSQKTDKKNNLEDDALNCNKVLEESEDVKINSDCFSITEINTDTSLEVVNESFKEVTSGLKESINTFIASKENEGISNHGLSLPKSPCEDSCKSKDNSESDTRISSASETSRSKSSRKRKRRRREFWWTKKRKRNERHPPKTNLCSLPTSFEWKESVNNNLLLINSVGHGKKNDVEMQEISQKKPREFAIPSPSLADNCIKAAIPECTATSNEVWKPKLCLCRKKPQVFISGNNNSSDLYCQALDCIDNRIVGCCNTIPSQDVGLYRASEKSSYQMMCTIHQQRLLRHNCCPGCGLFCTQGKYLMCKSLHHFHKSCFASDKIDCICCLHCGDTSLKFALINIHSSKDPVFLPLQKPIRNTKSAKISIVRENSQVVAEEVDDPSFNFSSSLFNLEGEDALSLNGVTHGLQRNKLAQLLNIACRSFSKTCHSNRYSFKSLFNAAHNGDSEKLLKVIASGINPNHVFEENNKQTALHVAATNGHLPAVHILLQAKAQINVFDGEQNTPLTAAINSKHNDIVKYLIKCGADLILKGEDGMTPLHIAAKCGNVGACFHILNGTHLPRRYIDTLDDGGWTPIVWASEFNHVDVVKFLISKGSDPLIKDAEQNIALHWAAFGGSIDIVEIFLNDGSDINAVNVHGDSPLHIAARQNKYSCVLLLLARGARSDIKNKNGELPRDCSDSPSSDIYKGITLNMEISALLTRFQDRTPRVISNDISRGKERSQIQCVNGVDDEEEPGDFVYVSESCFTSKITVDRTISSLQSCKCRDVCSTENCRCATSSITCWYDNDGKLRPDFNYSDPPLIFECNQACQCNRITCRNRVVQNGITCRFQLFRTENRGWGIRTLNLIPKGTFVCEYIGEIISDWEADHREDDSYLFDLENRDGETYCIDARFYGNFARFINHMCVPNIMPVHIFIDHQDLRFPRIAFFANKDILPNEELGYNYGDKFWVIKWKSFTCECGSEICIYSENTIKTTLENYHKKLSEENTENSEVLPVNKSEIP